MKRSIAEIDAELEEYRRLLESHQGRRMPDEEWSVFREANMREFSAVRADDVAPLEDGPASAQYWRRQDSWSSNEAYLLLVGVDPNKLDALLRNSAFEAFSVPLVADCIGKMMKRAEEVGRLRFPARPADVVKWAVREKGIRIPRVLRMLSAARGETGDDKADFIGLVRPLFDACHLQSAVLRLISEDSRFEPYLARYQLSTIKSWLREADPRPAAGRLGRPKKDQSTRD